MAWHARRALSLISSDLCAGFAAVLADERRIAMGRQGIVLCYKLCEDRLSTLNRSPCDVVAVCCR